MDSLKVVRSLDGESIVLTFDDEYHITIRSDVEFYNTCFELAKGDKKEYNLTGEKNEGIR